MRETWLRRASAFVALVSAIVVGGVTFTTLPASATGSSIEIVATGGSPEGSGWTNTAGVISATGAVSINAADVTTLLEAGSVEVSADTITVTAPLLWSASSILTLNSSGSLAVNSNIVATGASAGVELQSTPLYSLNTQLGASIQLTGVTPSLTINGQAFNVVNSQSQLANLTSASTFVALGRSLALTQSVTTSYINGTFSSTFDGLGNEISGLTVFANASASTNLGFFAELRGATVRNFGVTNALIQSTSTSNSNDIRTGVLAGSIGDSTRTSGWSHTAYTTTLSKVWTSGTVVTQDTGSSDAQDVLFAGGAIGNVNDGTLIMTDSHSFASVSAAGTTSCKMAVGGLIGGVNTADGGVGSIGLTVQRSYATGNTIEGALDPYCNFYGSGGLIGVMTSSAAGTISDSFSWSNIVATSASNGGLVGFLSASPKTVSASYTTYSRLGNGVPTTPNNYASVSTSTWTSLPAGYSVNTWSLSAGGMPVLLNQGLPLTPLYVQVSNQSSGAYTGISYVIVDAGANAVNLASLGLSAPTGQVTYTLAPSTPPGTYSVSYVSGLTLAGANAGRYLLAPYTVPGQVTITSALQPQTVTWAPTNVTNSSSVGQITPSASATSSGAGQISYSVINAGSSGCTVSGSNPPVISVSAPGDCVVRATAAATSTEAIAFKDVLFNFTTPLAAQTVTWAPTNTQALANTSSLTPNALATSSGTGSMTYSVQNAGTTNCSVNPSTAVITYSAAGTCVVRATAAANGSFASGFAETSFVIGSTTTSMTVNLNVSIGNSVTNGAVNYASTGLMPGTAWDLTLRSTPQVLSNGNVAGAGMLLGSDNIPAGLSPGWHSLTLSGTSLSGGFVSTAVWFEVSSAGALVKVQSTQPATPSTPSATSVLSRTGTTLGPIGLIALMSLLAGAAALIVSRARRVRS